MGDRDAHHAMLSYEGTLYRPPSEAESLILHASGVALRNVDWQPLHPRAWRRIAKWPLLLQLAGAAVLGYGADGKLTELRKGTNEMVCLASDPKATRFSASCYHKDLEPYMARGRELTAQGITAGARNQEYRWKEVKEGKLKMPKEPRMLYVLGGKNYDAASGKVVDGVVRWVIYVPFATAESTGLSTKSKRGEPWLMDAGTPGAHIMITPAAPPPAAK